MTWLGLGALASGIGINSIFALNIHDLISCLCIRAKYNKKAFIYFVDCGVDVCPWCAIDDNIMINSIAKITGRRYNTRKSTRNSPRFVGQFTNFASGWSDGDVWPTAWFS